jgi:hypothetical protein
MWGFARFHPIPRTIFLTPIGSDSLLILDSRLCAVCCWHNRSGHSSGHIHRNGHIHERQPHTRGQFPVSGAVGSGGVGVACAFVSHYQNDKEADFSGIILCVGLFMAACFVTLVDRGVRLLWQKFYAAWNLTKEVQATERQMVLPGSCEFSRRSAGADWASCSAPRSGTLAPHRMIPLRKS